MATHQISLKSRFVYQHWMQCQPLPSPLFFNYGHFVLTGWSITFCQFFLVLISSMTVRVRILMGITSNIITVYLGNINAALPCIAISLKPSRKWPNVDLLQWISLYVICSVQIKTLLQIPLLANNRTSTSWMVFWSIFGLFLLLRGCN